VDNGYSSFPG